ncbi:MAG: response regulator [Opitutales bacterium]|nr:response regulator [Opitutales bacterium]NRA27476.1 response regulator [Opitutales bacterium]
MKRGLHIDDSYTIYQIIASAGATMDMEFLHAADGESGLEILEEFYADLSVIILDYNMPGMNGLEVLEKIKENSAYRNIPVMMLTSESDANLVMECIKLGAANYLNKPFSQEDLVSKLMSLQGEAPW